MKFPNLTRRKGSAIYYFRRVVPPELRDEYGKMEVLVSLRTRDLAKAKSAYYAIAGKTEAEFAALRNDGDHKVNEHKANGHDTPNVALPSPTSPTNHYQSIISEDFSHRGEIFKQASADEHAFWRQEIISFPKTDWINFRVDEETRIEDVISHYFDERNKPRLEDARLALEAGDGSRFPDSLPPNEVRELLLAEIAALKTILGQEISAPAPAAIAGIPERPNETPTGPLLSAVVKKWIAEQSREAWSVEYRNEAEAILGGFMEVVGDKPISDCSKLDCRKFKTVLLKLPPNVKKRTKFKRLSLEKAADKAETLGLQPLSANTVNKRLNTVASFFNWAIKQYDEMGANPASGLGLKIRNSARSERDPFTVDELNTMFAAPIYTGCKSEHRWHVEGDKVLKKSAKFWVPVIGLYTGARLGEIVQLHTADVKKTGGIHFIDISPSDHEENPKTIKTASSVRRIPVHAALQECGFLDFVELRKSEGSIRLFPDYNRTAASGSWSDKFSKHFRRFLHHVGVKRTKNCFHSFRHSFEDACRNSGVAKEQMDALQGHTSGGMGDRYGRGFDLKPLDEAMQQIKYEGLDLGHLRG